MNRPLDILYLGLLPPQHGGGNISASQILTRMAKLGHRIRSIARIRESDLNGGDQFATGHPELSIRRYRLPSTQKEIWVPAPPEVQRLESEQIHALLEAAIEERRPDLLFLGRENYCTHAVPVASQHGLPTILRVAGSLLGAIRKGWYPDPLARALIEHMKQISLVCPQAEHMAAALRDLGLTRIRTIPNLVDMERFAPCETNGAVRRQLSIGHSHIMVLHMSNMKSMKRPDDIVRAAPAVLAEQPRTTFVIIGNGPARDTAEDLCRRMELSPHFRFVDWVAYETVPDYLNSADIIVMASEFEHQARIYLETQSCGRVLVSSDVPGAREVVEDGETGLLFRMGDANDLARKILLAASDAPLRARIGRQARERVMKHDINKVVQTYISTMYDIVNTLISARDTENIPLST